MHINIKRTPKPASFKAIDKSLFFTDNLVRQIGEIRHDAVTAVAAQFAHIRGVVDGPKLHGDIVAVGVVNKLARAEVDDFFSVGLFICPVGYLQQGIFHIVFFKVGI